MKNTLKTLLAALLALTFLFGFSAVALAAEEEPYDPGIIEEEPYEIISSYSSNISVSGGTAKCSANMRASGASKVTIKMELQKKSNGSYSTVATWNGSANGSSTSLSKSKGITSGATYRLKTTFKATKSGTTETAVQYKNP